MAGVPLKAGAERADRKNAHGSRIFRQNRWRKAQALAQALAQDKDKEQGQEQGQGGPNFHPSSSQPAS
ncbi:GL19833 [Drosophila persimilis]|uniref:GL19833 n=1 Tax=Drosophila persimilis TaxID=7234 RepID=B4GYB5_DROPE|nr:GL19833 [Drosophila persimilis]